MFIGKDSSIQIGGKGTLGQVFVVAETIIIDGTDPNIGSGGSAGINISPDAELATESEYEYNLLIEVAETLNVITEALQI